MRHLDPAPRSTGQVLGRWLAGPVGLVCLVLFATPAGAEVTGGLDHSCAITPSKTVECWGRNNQGQLGDGTFVDRLLPVEVTGLDGLVIASIDSGEAFTCIQTDFGALYCWGRNTEGQLGDGTSVMSPTPVAVGGLDGTVESFSAGRQHLCAQLTGGSLRCWGDNLTGQLGDGTNLNRATPTAVSGLSEAISSVASGFDHTCAVSNSGNVFCWGDNTFGQLGDDGVSIDSNVPTAVVGISGDAAGVAAGGYHNCVWTTAGALLCWGDNFYGQLGNAIFEDHLIPTAVAGLGGAVQAADAGDSFTCGLLLSGELQCWGENLDGQLGDGTTVDRTAPVTVSVLGDSVVEIGLGQFHACAETDLGEGYCWGDNSFGQLGDGSQVSASAPVPFFVSMAVPLSFPLRFALGALLALGGVAVSLRRSGCSAGTTSAV